MPASTMETLTPINAQLAEPGPTVIKFGTKPTPSTAPTWTTRLTAAANSKRLTCNDWSTTVAVWFWSFVVAVLLVLILLPL